MGGVTLDTNRRNFLKLSDAGLMLAGCRDDDFDYPQNGVFNLGKGDVGVSIRLPYSAPQQDLLLSMKR